MRSANLTGPYPVAGGVTLVPKTKRCGKDNCGDCPHGPYWYARAPHTATLAGARFDLYLGPHWSDRTLLEKVTPHLAPAARAEFEQRIQRVLDREKLDELDGKIAYQIKEIAQMRADFDEELANHRGYLRDTQAERAALRFKLNPPTKSPRSPAGKPKPNRLKGKKAHA